MPHHLIAALALALALAGCASKTDTSSTTTDTASTISATTSAKAQQAGDLKLSVRFAPEPPKQGPETITVTLEDASGNRVKGAGVTIATNMPKMSMRGPALTASDNGDGTYSAQTNLNYATPWTFDVRAKAGSKTGHASIQADVK